MPRQPLDRTVGRSEPGKIVIAPRPITSSPLISWPARLPSVATLFGMRCGPGRNKIWRPPLGVLHFRRFRQRPVKGKKVREVFRALLAVLVVDIEGNDVLARRRED